MNIKKLFFTAIAIVLFSSFVYSETKGRFFETLIKGKLIVLDSDTSLTWTKEYQISKSWTEAKNYCTKLNYGGYADWRLPDISEMKTLVNKDKRGPATDFHSMPSKIFWSSDTFELNKETYARTLDFTDGEISYAKKTGEFYARCVR